MSTTTDDQKITEYTTQIQDITSRLQEIKTDNDQTTKLEHELVIKIILDLEQIGIKMELINSRFDELEKKLGDALSQIQK
jgi:hypothetical protein